MSFVRRHAVPLAAAIAAAAAAFAVVVVTTDGGGPAGDGGPATARASGGLAVFTRMGCGSCHRLAAADSTGPIGPDLDERLQGHTRESLTAVILRPPAGSPMPEDFGARMDNAEFDALLDFLLAQREPR
jgi:mono/diheme cytochrome c family protein